jgi:hypothetical protein
MAQKLHQNNLQKLKHGPNKNDLSHLLSFSRLKNANIPEKKLPIKLLLRDFTGLLFHFPILTSFTCLNNLFRFLHDSSIYYLSLPLSSSSLLSNTFFLFNLSNLLCKKLKISKFLNLKFKFTIILRISLLTIIENAIIC